MLNRPTYVVVVNVEHQYALWPARRAVPAGWEASFGPAPRDDCLIYVEQVWRDITPFSLRAAVDAAAS